MAATPGRPNLRRPDSDPAVAAVDWRLVYSVIVIGTLDPSNARGLAMFQTSFERIATAIADLDAAATMPR